MSDYICPYCGADDSTRCAFLISGKTGTVVKRFQDRAREVRCRVMHYTDERISAPKDLR